MDLPKFQEMFFKATCQQQFWDKQIHWLKENQRDLRRQKRRLEKQIHVAMMDDVREDIMKDVTEQLEMNDKLLELYSKLRDEPMRNYLIEKGLHQTT